MDERLILTGEDIQRTLKRIAHEIAEKNPDPDAIALVGIHTRGAVLAERIAPILSQLTGGNVPRGDLDISFYRDDVGTGKEIHPTLHDTHLEFDLADKTVVLVDDVLFTGRTVRAAIDGLFDYGRPARVQLAVLCDRGHRELPFRADFVGKNLPTSNEERVNVKLNETDEIDEVSIGPAVGARQ